MCSSVVVPPSISLCLSLLMCFATWFSLYLSLSASVYVIEASVDVMSVDVLMDEGSVVLF